MSKIKIDVVDYNSGCGYTDPNQRVVGDVKNITVFVDNGRLAIELNNDEIFYTMSLLDGSVSISLQDGE